MSHNRSAALERSVQNYWGGLKPVLRVPNLALSFYHGSKHTVVRSAWRKTPFKRVLDFDLQPYPGAWTLESKLMAWKQTFQGTHGHHMDGWWDIPHLRNFNVNSINVTEGGNEKTYKRSNGRTERRKLYTPRHKCQGNNQSPYPSTTPDRTQTGKKQEFKWVHQNEKCKYKTTFRESQVRSQTSTRLVSTYCENRLCLL